MNIQNFQLLQTYSKRERELDRLDRRQSSLISILKNEYANLRKIDKEKSSEKSRIDLKKIRKEYSILKLPKTEQKIQKHDEGNIFINGWLKTNFKNFSPKWEELNEKRKKMIHSGNVFSKKNTENKSPQSIGRAFSMQIDPKREMLKRRTEVGNFHSSQFLRKNFAKQPPMSPKSDERKLNLSSFTTNNTPSFIQKNCCYSPKKFKDEKKTIKSHNNKNLINEISVPSIYQMEVTTYSNNEQEQKINRLRETIGIEEILAAAEEVKKKVSQQLEKEMIDYSTINDVIMIEEKKNDGEKEKVITTQIECFVPSGEMDGVKKVAVDKGDTAIDEYRKNLSESSKILREKESSYFSAKSSNESKEEENANFSAKSNNSVSQQVPFNRVVIVNNSKVDKLTSISEKSTEENLKSASNKKYLPSIISKLSSVFGGTISTQLNSNYVDDDEAGRTIEKICENQHSSSEYNENSKSRNADMNQESMPSSQPPPSTSPYQKECKLQNDLPLRATSTFTSERDIFARKMEIRRKKTENDVVHENENNTVVMTMSPSKLSSDSATMNEVLKNVETFDN